MQNKLIFVGNIYAIAKKMYEDKETVNIQFLNKLPNGGIEIIQVKLTDENDSKTIKEGELVQIPIKVTSFNGKIYYTQVEKIKRWYI